MNPAHSHIHDFRAATCPARIRIYSGKDVLHATW